MKKILMPCAVAMLLFSCAGQPGAETAQNVTPVEKTTTLADITFTNDYFYPGGTFDPEKAKDAVMALMQYHNYPAIDGIREILWVSDYGRGDFAHLGLAAICPTNNTDDLYMLQDLFLLPGQMLPEHWHEKPKDLPVKMEAWFIRNGSSYIAGIGQDNLSDFPEVVIPKSHMDGVVTEKHVVKATPGMTVKLEKAKTRHWQYAGKEGAIMSEVANVHSNADVRHSDKVANDDFLKSL